MESTGASYVASSPSTTLEEVVRSTSGVDDTPEVITLLQQILVLDPLRRPDASDLLNHPWFVGLSNPAPIRSSLTSIWAKAKKEKPKGEEDRGEMMGGGVGEGAESEGPEKEVREGGAVIPHEVPTVRASNEYTMDGVQ